MAIRDALCARIDLDDWFVLVDYYGTGGGTIRVTTKPHAEDRMHYGDKAVAEYDERLDSGTIVERHLQLMAEVDAQSIPGED